jgi:hypothetical protein
MVTLQELAYLKAEADLLTRWTIRRQKIAFIFKLLCFDTKLVVTFLSFSFPGCASSLAEASLPLPTLTHLMKQSASSESDSTSARECVIVFYATCGLITESKRHHHSKLYTATWIESTWYVFKISLHIISQCAAKFPNMCIPFRF